MFLAVQQFEQFFFFFLKNCGVLSSSYVNDGGGDMTILVIAVCIGEYFTTLVGTCYRYWWWLYPRFARILGECSTIHSLPALSSYCFKFMFLLF